VCTLGAYSATTTPIDATNALTITIHYLCYLLYLHYRLAEIVGVLAGRPDAEAFKRPVSKKEAPDYSAKVPHPMDLQTLEKKAKEHQYKTKEAFLTDLKLIGSNSLLYNGPHSDLTQRSSRIVLDGESQIQQQAAALDELLKQAAAEAASSAISISGGGSSSARKSGRGGGKGSRGGGAVRRTGQGRGAGGAGSARKSTKKATPANSNAAALEAAGVAAYTRLPTSRMPIAAIGGGGSSSAFSGSSGSALGGSAFSSNAAAAAAAAGSSASSSSVSTIKKRKRPDDGGTSSDDSGEEEETEGGSVL
jgi:Bromodomain